MRIGNSPIYSNARTVLSPPLKDKNVSTNKQNGQDDVFRPEKKTA
jgi:hypothetical protein